MYLKIILLLLLKHHRIRKNLFELKRYAIYLDTICEINIAVKAVLNLFRDALEATIRSFFVERVCLNPYTIYARYTTISSISNS